jgi:hypothetical protein
MPTAGGAQHCWILLDALYTTAAAAATTICEGVTMARDKPILTYFMYFM